MTKRYLKTPEEVIQALQDKKEVFDFLDNNYKLVNGIIIYRTQKGSWGINAHIGHADKLYVNEPEQIKLEVGKFYRTRRGDKVIVLYINDKADAGCWPVLVSIVGKANCSYSVSKTGSYYSSGRDTVWDIVAPWED